MLALGLMLCTSASAELSLEIEPGHDSLRFEVPDSLYAAGVPANFSGLQLKDQQGRSVDFAVCPIRQNSSLQQAVTTLAVPDLARPVLASDGQLSFTRPAGAGAAERLDAWILDLRQLDGQLSTLSGLPTISSLRSSPNLQQWSAEIPFQQQAEEVQLDLAAVSFVRVKPADVSAWDSQALQVTATTQQQGQRKPHWFSVAAQTDGLYLNTRGIPIFAARIQQDASLQSWQLHSRQGRWDAWKPRGQYRSGHQKDSVIFSAVSDPQWRVSGEAQGDLQLAHAAHEIRIPQLDKNQALALIYQADKRGGPNLSCAATAALAPQSPQQITLLGNDTEPTSAPQTNLRKYFLGLLAVLIVSGYLLRRFLLRRRPG